MKQVFFFDLMLSDCSSVRCSFEAHSLVAAFMLVQEHVENDFKDQDAVVVAIDFIASEPA